MQGTVYGIRFSMLVPRMRDFRILLSKNSVCQLGMVMIPTFGMMCGWVIPILLSGFLELIIFLKTVSSIANMGVWDSFFGIRNFRQRKALGGRGIIVFNSLFDKVSEVELSSEVVDKLIWKMGCIQSNHVQTSIIPQPV